MWQSTASGGRLAGTSKGDALPSTPLQCRFEGGDIGAFSAAAFWEGAASEPTQFSFVGGRGFFVILGVFRSEE
jgi:hypothetical protein